ncbi:MAG TPA: methyltransferase [Archaeoglobus veneficus]|nr:methyltransferase [Archaeoglobus veneficus]
MDVHDLLQEPSKALEFDEMLKNAMDGFRIYCLILSAVKLKIFDVLKTPKGADEIAEELRCNDKKLLYVLCEVLKSKGLILEENGKYRNSEVAEDFLTSDSFFSQCKFIENTFGNLRLWLELHEIVKHGVIKRARKDASKFFAETVIHSLAQNALLGELQKTVKIVSEFEEFKNARRLLDLGGGHGLYAMAFTALNENLKAYVFDLPHVVEKTKEYIRKFNANRVDVIAGNFFVYSIGSNYDVVFSSYNPGGKKAELIPKIYESLNKNGLYVNKQYFSDSNDSNFTLIDLEWNLWGFDIEKAEKTYTFKGDLSFKNYIKELEKVGFEILKVVDMNANDKMNDKMIIAKKI